jgi:multidrug efflux pump subunit AcrA (membrane-fusion protein)
VLRRYAPWLALAVAVGVLVVNHPTAADDPPGKDKEKDKGKSGGPKAPTVKVEKGPLTAAVTLKGVVQAEKAEEVSLRPKSWTGTLLVKKAVEHGSAVKAGDVVVEFDTEKIDLALRDARQERDLAEIAIRQAEAELPVLERQVPLDLASAERTARQASEDLRRFLDVDRPLAEESAAFMLKSVSFYLEYAKDELKQLQKMYRDKDLTEETERIILKRYQHRVEMYEFFVKEAKIDTDHILKVQLPRKEQTVKEAVEKADLALAKARDVQPLAVKQKQLALVKLRYEEKKAKERLADLEADREALTVKAPADGLAYYGRFVRGQWMIPSGPQGHALSRGGMVQPGEVFLTIVAPTPLVVRADAEEKELPGLKPGTAGKLTPLADPEAKVPAKLARIAPAPQNGKFEVRIELDGDRPARLVPGMSCSVRFVTARKENALTVPVSAVFEDDDEAKYVYRSGKAGGKPEKKTVKVGITAGDRVEIVEGLSEGDEILSSKPKPGE